jgi:predicted Zn-dependent peptidase
MRRIYLVVLILGLLSSVQAQNQIEFEEYDLDNGLHVILHQKNKTPIVAVTMLYHVGSKNEDPKRTGFAHFFEHLLFEGSENIERGEFQKYVQNAGGTYNANTSADRTFYFEILPSNQLELGLWLESERLMHPIIDDKGIETQREVVKEERRQRYDNAPYGTLLEEVLARAYKEHPYQYTPIGSMKDLNSAKREDFASFYERFYVPNNATLSIAGDIDIEETKKLVEQYFGDIPRGGEVPRPTVVEPPLGKEVTGTVYDKKISLPAVVHAFRIPEQGSEDYYAVDMLASLLSVGKSSRIYRSIVEDKEMAIQAQVIPLAFEDPGVSITFCIASSGTDVKDLSDAIDQEYLRVRNTLVTEEEFEKLQNQKVAQLSSSFSSAIGIAEALANYHTYFGDANLINTEIERYKNVTREDLKRVANKYFVPENRVKLYWRPQTAY